MNPNLVLIFAASALTVGRAGAVHILGPIGLPFKGIGRAILGLAAFVAIAKFCDLVLALRRGVVAVITLLAILNAATVYYLAMVIAPPLVTGCQRVSAVLALNLPATFCANTIALPAALGSLAFILTVMLNAQDLVRDANDKGFVAVGYVAERNRSNDL